MATVFEKLNFKGQREILVINAPASFTAEVFTLTEVTIIQDVERVSVFEFAIVFATKQAEVEQWTQQLNAKAKGDVVLWFAYPKGTSKRFTCEFNRDSGWDSLRSLGFDSVRQIAIDADWTALRFRRNEFIKSATSAQK